MTLTNIGINSTCTEILDYLPDFNLSNGELFAPRVWSFFLIDIKNIKISKTIFIRIGLR